MAKNTLSDLNNHLFAQLERLGEEDLTPDKLKMEVERSKMINGVAKNIIDNARVTLEGTRFLSDNLPRNGAMPDQFKLKEQSND